MSTTSPTARTTRAAMCPAICRTMCPAARPCCSSTNRRAVALLVSLIMTAGFSLVIVRIAAHCTLAAQTHALVLHETMADDLLRTLAEPLQHWLSDHASTAVLAPDVIHPAVELLNDRLLLGRVPTHVRVLATDPLGRTPLPSQTGPLDAARVNISTAPIAHLRSLGLPNARGEIDAVSEDRSQGRRPAIPASWLRLPQPLRAVNTSSRWEISMELSVGRVSKRWHATYALGADRWECISREVRHE